jgi:hypothetical protein
MSNFDNNLSDANEMGRISGVVTNHTTNVGDLVFDSYTDGLTESEAMRIDKDGDVTIENTLAVKGLNGNDITDPQLLVHPNATSNDAYLEVRGARNGSTVLDQANIVFSNYDDDLSATNYIAKITGKITNATTNVGDLLFFVTSDGTSGNLTEAMRIDKDGDVTTQGNLDATTLSVGGGTQISTLSEATYTPTFGDGTNEVTYLFQTGAYQRIGNWVHLQGGVGWSAKGSISGTVYISLPVAPAGNDVFTLRYTGLNLPGTDTHLHVVGANSIGNGLSLEACQDNGAATTLTDTHVNASGIIYFAGSYKV